MSSNVVVVTREQLLARRRELLSGLRTTLEALRMKSETTTLVGPELDALDELEEIAFLLGERAE